MHTDTYGEGIAAATFKPRYIWQLYLHMLNFGGVDLNHGGVKFVWFIYHTDQVLNFFYENTFSSEKNQLIRTTLTIL